MSLYKYLKDKNDKYNDWEKKPLSYDYKRIFLALSVIYCIATLYDLTFTYVTFHFSPNHFFEYELSAIIKEVFRGSLVYTILLIVLFLLPLVLTHYINMRSVKKYGYSVNSIKFLFFAIYLGSLMHVIGGLTNFFYLINLR